MLFCHIFSIFAKFIFFILANKQTSFFFWIQSILKRVLFYLSEGVESVLNQRVFLHKHPHCYFNSEYKYVVLALLPPGARDGGGAGRRAEAASAVSGRQEEAGDGPERAGGAD